MNRREMLTALTGIVAATGVAAEAKVIDKEPEPLLAVLTVDREISRQAMANISDAWQALWKGNPPCRVAVLTPGMTLDVIRDPRSL